MNIFKRDYGKIENFNPNKKFFQSLNVLLNPSDERFVILYGSFGKKTFYEKLQTEKPDCHLCDIKVNTIFCQGNPCHCPGKNLVFKKIKLFCNE